MSASDKKICVRRETDRPAPDIWSSFVGAASSMVADAQGRRGALDPAIRPLTQHVSFAGPALTVECRPGDNAAALAALDYIRAGDVVVMANGSATVAAIVGGHFAVMAAMRGAAGIVSDGPGRDIDEIGEIGLPCFARGYCPNGPFKTGPGSVGLPIAIGGVAIETGDLVVADIDGVVIVPRGLIGACAAQLDRIREREREASALIAQGKTPPWLTEKLDEIGIDYV